MNFFHRDYSVIKRFISHIIPWSSGRTTEVMLAGTRVGNIIRQWGGALCSVDRVVPLHTHLSFFPLMVRIRKLLTALEQLCLPHHLPSWKKCSPSRHSSQSDLKPEARNTSEVSSTHQLPVNHEESQEVGAVQHLHRTKSPLMLEFYVQLTFLHRSLRLLFHKEL